MSTSPSDHDEFTARLRERLGQVGPSTTIRDIVDEDVVVEVYRVEVDEETMRRHAAVTMRNGRRYHPYLKELWTALISEARGFLPPEGQDRLIPYEWASAPTSHRRSRRQTTMSPPRPSGAGSSRFGRPRAVRP